MNLGPAFWMFALATIMPCPGFAAAEPIAAAKSAVVTTRDAVLRGEKFLAGLFDPEIDLLPEYRGSRVYWLFHDNYLAARVLEVSRPDLASRLRAALVRHGFTNSGKIEIVFHEASKPLPFRAYLLTNIVTAGGRTIRTEILTDQVTKDWESYADLLLLAAIAESRSDPRRARGHFDRAEALWDGRGLADKATQKMQRYATYKLALYLLAAKNLHIQAAHAGAARTRLLALQNQEGGWITDYDASLKPVGLANVETSCLAILALREPR